MKWNATGLKWLNHVVGLGPAGPSSGVPVKMPTGVRLDIMQQGVMGPGGYLSVGQL